MPASTVSTTFAATGSTPEVLVPRGQTLSYSLSGTFVGTVVLQQLIQGQWVTLSSLTAPGVATIVAENTTQQEPSCRYRATCTAYTSGSPVAALTMGGSADDYVVLPYLAADYTASTGTWVPTAAQVATARYKVTGKRCHVLFGTTAGTPSGTPTFLAIPVPPGVVPASKVRTPFGYTNTTAGIGVVGVDAAGTVIKMFKDATEIATFAASAYTCNFSLEFDLV